MSGANRTCVVIDTNVLAVAEGMYPAATEACLAACIDLARQVEMGVPVAVDSGDEILTEYLTTLRRSRASGLGAKLAFRLFRMRRDLTVCHRVDLSPTAGPAATYAEVPGTLRNFDADDQKFIAVAVAESCAPQLFTAVDGEWWGRRRDFADAGIDLQFCCPGEFMARERGDG